MDANEKQIGGEHYKSTYQHWDFVKHTMLDYLPAQITRYVARWRKKDGIKDLEKALHYVEKLIQEDQIHRTYCNDRVEVFVRENRLQHHERIVFNMLVNYKLGDVDRLYEARDNLEELLSIIKGERPLPVIPVEPEFRDNGDEWRR